MAWVIAIVCIILVIIFWRIFLPLALVIAAIGGVVFLWVQYDEKTERQEAARVWAANKQKIAKARKTATPEGKRWRVRYEKDPANGLMIARTAWIISNDRLCTLNVEKRINGTELTAIYCPDFKLDSYRDIEVKFSEANISRTMDISEFNNSDDVYISSSQRTPDMPYKEFIVGLKSNKAVAIKLTTDDNTWMTFNLENGRAAIDSLGQTKAAPE